MYINLYNLCEKQKTTKSSTKLFLDSFASRYVQKNAPFILLFRCTFWVPSIEYKLPGKCRISCVVLALHLDGFRCNTVHGQNPAPVALAVHIEDPTLRYTCYIYLWFRCLVNYCLYYYSQQLDSLCFNDPNSQPPE